MMSQRKYILTLFFGLNLAELSMVIYFALISFLVLLHFWQVEHAAYLLVGYGCIVAGLLGLTFLKRRLPDNKQMLLSLPLLTIGIVVAFSTKGFYIHAVNPHDMEVKLIEFDHMLFGMTAAEALERYCVSWFSDWLQVCYSSYYFLPFPLFVLIYRKKKYREASHLVALVVIGFLSSYIGYLMVPARSPYVIHRLDDLGHLLHFRGPVCGGSITHFIREVLDKAELNKRDCFPSGHTEVSLVVLLSAWRYYRKAFLPYLVVIASLIFATLYLRYHYLIDLIAGAGLAFVLMGIVPRLDDWWLERMKIWLRNPIHQRTMEG